MAPEHISPGLGHQLMTPRIISSGLVPQPPSPTPNVPPTKNDWDSVFFPMFDEYFNPSPSVVQPVLVAVVQEHVVSTGTYSSTRIDQDTPSISTSQTTKEEQSHVSPTSVEEYDHGIEVAHIDNDLQQLSKGLSEGYGITPEVPDEPKDNSVVVAEKQAGYVQTNLTLSSAELEIQSMVDVPIYQEDLAVQRTPLIDPVISMVTKKTASTPIPPTTQAHVQMCSTSCWKDISRGV
ncbi:hypothetical protein Tco_0445596 [Tanacetum coccineum]